MPAIVYARHGKARNRKTGKLEECPHKDERYYRDCRCPKWIFFENEDRRVSAKTRSWGRALEVAREMESASTSPEAPKPAKRTVATAVEDYLKDKKQQNVGDEWYDKLDQLLTRTLVPWCQSKPVLAIAELSVDHLKEFRGTLIGNPLTRSKKQERLRSFLRYCKNHGWIANNPAKLLSRIKVDRVPTDYFTPSEMQKILVAVDQLDAFHERNPEVLKNRARVRAMVLLLRWSGLRLGDAARLERSRLQDSKLMLYTQKTGTPVWVPLPPHVVDALKELKNSNEKYFFWTGNGNTKTTVDDWWRTFSRVFSHAKLGKRAHPHMFRDTFAVEMLLSGVPIEQVAILLGHSSIKITEKSYAPWVKARQEQLEQNVCRAWTSNND